MSEQDPDQKPQDTHSIGRMIGGAIDSVFDTAVDSVGSVGRLLGSALHLTGLAPASGRGEHYTPGATPGIEHSADITTPPQPGEVQIQCIDYSPDRVEVSKHTDIDAFLAAPRPDWAAVRWVNIDGLHAYVINKVREAVGMHTLAAEDVLHIPQRPRVEPYDEDLFIITRMMRLIEGRLVSEQVSMFMNKGLVVTFQETQGDVWEPIRERIHRDGSRLRKNNPSYLVYTLLDAMIDHCFPLLERYGDLLEDMEAVVLASPDAKVLSRIHAIKRELSALRRVMWPMREVVAGIRDAEIDTVADITRTYLRDVYEHTVQIVEIIETYREVTAGLTDLHMSTVSNRMNETMKVLTIMATLFIPITFLAGIYGMNFQYIPELGWKYSYAMFWVACVVIVSGLLWYFKRKGWIGSGS